MSKTAKTVTTDPIAILRFTQDANSTRTASASDPNDDFQTYVSLGTHIGNFIDKSLDRQATSKQGATVSTIGYQHPVIKNALFGAKDSTWVGIGGARSVTLNAGIDPSVYPLPLGKINAPKSVKQQCCNFKIVYSGTSQTMALQPLSKATNPVTIYDGVILLGVGDYKKF